MVSLGYGVWLGVKIMASVLCGKGIHCVTLTWGGERRTDLSFCQVRFSVTCKHPRPSGGALG